jgi:hypothetical protein
MKHINKWPCDNHVPNKTGSEARMRKQTSIRYWLVCICRIWCFSPVIVTPFIISSVVVSLSRTEWAAAAAFSLVCKCVCTSNGIAILSCNLLFSFASSSLSLCNCSIMCCCDLCITSVDSANCFASFLNACIPLLSAPIRRHSAWISVLVLSNFFIDRFGHAL